MTKTIDQFMWEFQHWFRFHIQIQIRRVLEELGLAPTDTKVVLVGIATDAGARHAICVEPETGPLLAEHLESVMTRAQEIYQSDPESQWWVKPQLARESVNRRLFRSARADAIVEAIEKSGVFADFSFFASLSSPVNEYEVHTCIGVPKGTIENLPVLREFTVGSYHAAKSLQHQVIEECLYRADKALYIPNAGEGFLGALGNSNDIITSAANSFIHGVLWRTAAEPSDLFSRLNEIASLTYERDGAKGNLAITKRDNLEKWLTVRLSNPVRLRESRAMRKLLQTSDDTMVVLADQGYAYGLGTSKTAPDVMEVDITGHARWEASVNGAKFIRVAYGNATIPNQPVTFEELEDTAERVIGNTNTKRIWEIIQAAQENGQGATIVVSIAPEAETARLSNDGMVIEPDYLEPETIIKLGSVDGAVVVGPDGRCYAFGVILDGIANENGDRARGARFNSAVRYQNMEEIPNSMIVVISDDGTTDLLPRLMPRVDRAEVAAAVDDFCRCCDSTPVDGEEFARLYDRVKLFRFYLNAEQCRRVNEKYGQEMDRRLASGGAKITGRDLKPDPQMNESYFWDSQSNLAQ